MLTATTIKTSIAILAVSFATATSAQAQLSSCTPSHLASAFRQVEAQCGKARVVSGHRAGAVIRGTRRVSQHAFCNGTNGGDRRRVQQQSLRALGVAEDQLHHSHLWLVGAHPHRDRRLEPHCAQRRTTDPCRAKAMAGRSGAIQRFELDERAISRPWRVSSDLPCTLTTLTKPPGGSPPGGFFIERAGTSILRSTYRFNKDSSAFTAAGGAVAERSVMARASSRR